MLFLIFLLIIMISLSGTVLRKMPFPVWALWMFATTIVLFIANALPFVGWF